MGPLCFADKTIPYKDDMLICFSARNLPVISIIFIVFRTFTALIGCLVIFSTLLDYLNDCNQSNVYISKSNGFMPHEPVNEANDSALEAQGEQPLLAHNDVKKPGGT